ncbi:hypothetical protein [Micromonospora sp. NBC_01412]|uniref:hypothetical protein n=1 Tax=Micromonospora sp. NBC_01412 TaxID=2903590 RepID=UPI0032498833
MSWTRWLRSPLLRPPRSRRFLGTHGFSADLYEQRGYAVSITGGSHGYYDAEDAALVQDGNWLLITCVGGTVRKHNLALWGTTRTSTTSFTGEWQSPRAPG